MTDIKDAYNQPGGYREIDFRDMHIVAPLNDVKSALRTIQESDEDYRYIVKQSVDAELDRMYESIFDGEAPLEDAMRFGQDVAIWFAFEVFEGRAPLEQTMVN